MADPRHSHRTDGGLRASRGAARRQQWRMQEWVRGLEISSSGHWRIGSPLRAGRDQQERRREERGQFDLQSSIPVNKIPLHVQQSQMYNQLTLCSGTGAGAPLHAHTVHCWLVPSPMAASWWALSPALAPGLMGRAQLPRQSSAQLISKQTQYT